MAFGTGVEIARMAVTERAFAVADLLATVAGVTSLPGSGSSSSISQYRSVVSGTDPGGNVPNSKRLPFSSSNVANASAPSESYDSANSFVPMMTIESTMVVFTTLAGIRSSTTTITGMIPNIITSYKDGCNTVGCKFVEEFATPG